MERAHLEAARVLVVDAHDDARETTAWVLRQAGYAVRPAADAAEALAAAAGWRPDAVLLELALPGVDGLELARRLRAAAGGDRLLVAALTGWARDEDRRRAWAAGCDLLLAKPAEPERLLRLLAGLVRRPPTRAADVPFPRHWLFRPQRGADWN